MGNIGRVTTKNRYVGTTTIQRMLTSCTCIARRPTHVCARHGSGHHTHCGVYPNATWPIQASVRGGVVPVPRYLGSLRREAF